MLTVVFKIILFNYKSWRFSAMFSTRNFVTLGFTFRSMICLP